MPSEHLGHLPPEVKTLVNDGVYSLYSVKNRPGVEYVLVTNEGPIYPLTALGDVAPGVSIKNVTELELGDAVSFSDVRPRPTTLTLNYAY